MQVTASLDTDTISMDESAQLTVTVSGTGLERAGDPVVPALSGVRIISTSTEQSFSMVNGAVSTTHGYVYVLQPTRTGKVSLPPFRVAVGGKTYATAPLTLTVTAGGAGGSRRGGNQPLLPQSSGWPPIPDPFGGSALPSPSPKDAVAVRQNVDRKRAYVGQQVTYTFSFCQAEQLSGDVNYQPAATPGFIAESLPNPPNSNETINGRTYAVQRRQKALFATTPGPHTIGKATVTVSLDPLGGETDFAAPPVTVNVVPLPTAGRPADFGGGVGQFRVTLGADRPAVRAGETINVQVQVSGNGNIRSLAAPSLGLPAWARPYPAGETRKAEAGGAGNPLLIGGTATFNYLVLPRQAGALKLGPIRYSYFDPVAGAYRTVQSNAVVVTVTPGAAGTESVVAPAGGLRPLRTMLGRRVTAPVTTSLWFWALLALPLVVVACTGWKRWQLVAMAADPLHARAQSALRLAEKRFGKAAACAQQADCDGCYAELQAALCDYVADRLGAPPAGLTADTVQQRLLAAGCPGDLAEQARMLLERAAGGRYSPGGSDPGRAAETVRECATLVKRLQAEVKPPHA